MYVVTGVTGNTGRVVAETLLAQKEAVRVVVRDAQKGEEWKRRGAEVASAELDDVEALGQALRGAKGAYLLLPPQMASTNVRADNLKRAQGYVKAIEASGVAHVVLLSSIGAQHAAGTGPIATLHDAEALLTKTKAAVTSVRAAYFMENWGSSLYALAGGILPTFVKKDLVIPMIATQDIGTTVAKTLVEGGRGHSVIELSGPRDCSPNDVAAALSRVTGKTITAQEGPEDAMIPALTGAGLSPHWAALYKEMTHGLNAKHVAWEGGSARAVRGATPIDTVLAKLLAAK